LRRPTGVRTASTMTALRMKTPHLMTLLNKPNAVSVPEHTDPV
jgi:hypothetical protein